MFCFVQDAFFQMIESANEDPARMRELIKGIDVIKYDFKQDYVNAKTTAVP